MMPVAQLGTAGNPFAGPPMGEVDLAAAEQEARRMLAEATAGARERYPDVPVTLLPAHALNPVTALLDETQKGGLLVVSRHGGNALSRLLFSSVGDVAVRQAPCPVAVVPESSVALSEFPVDSPLRSDRTG
jgi:nucleotide-binding universal stress UspA family protein